MTTEDKGKFRNVHYCASEQTYTNLPTKSAQDLYLIPMPTIPSKTSDLTNDSGFITSSGSITGNAATATEATNYSASGGIATALSTKEDTLNADQKRKITISTADPTGGSDGDIWLKYSE